MNQRDSSRFPRNHTYSIPFATVESISMFTKVVQKVVDFVCNVDQQVVGFNNKAFRFLRKKCTVVMD